MKRSQSQPSHPIDLISLWRQFLPLSLSDVSMACGDPLTTTTLAHLPAARVNLAAVGVAKAIAIFFESPIIMLLHAANALAGTQKSRRALWKFMLIASGGLSLMLATIALPGIFNLVGEGWLGVPQSLSATVRLVIALMILWPFAIGWRRYFQGLLIHSGHSHAIAQAGILRLAVVGTILAIGFTVGMSGAILAGISLVGGVIAEAIAVTIAAYRLGASQPPPLETSPKLPSNLPEVWQFYWPLGSSMLIVWGGRAVLVGIIARAPDAPIALAAWPAAWGLVLVIANATRMVQQIIIRNRDRVKDRLLITFALSVGAVCSLLLLLLSATPWSYHAIGAFIGSDRDLIAQVRPVLTICAGIPLLVALQNATQGFLVSDGRTLGVNYATWVGTTVMLASAYGAVQIGIAGAIAAAIAMTLGSISEIAYLSYIFQRSV